MARSAFLPDGVEARYNVMVPMRDGVRLSADIYFPREQQESYPVVLSRTPYDNMAESLTDNGFFYASRWTNLDYRKSA